MKNFSEFYHIPIQTIYKKGLWKRLCVLSEQIEDYATVNEPEISRAISKKWLSSSSSSYFEFILSLARKNFSIKMNELNEEEKAMCLMLHYDVWQDEGGFVSLEESINAIGRNKTLSDEITELLEILIDRIGFIEKPVSLPYSQPLKLHGRHTRDQILSAYGFYSFEKKPSYREGVAYSSKKNTELLFVTLNKSEKDFSPTTLYEDFAISETIFHWQTQNAVSPGKGKGLSYIEHKKSKKKILLFVREKNEDEFGNTMGFIFLGEANMVEHYGSRPMSIKWELNEPMPAYLWKDSAKMAVG
ncbi:MAG: DUF3427 domain-containing protein [Cyclobacteriaceae bacterium]